MTAEGRGITPIKGAFVGLSVPSRGIHRNRDRLFVPASNTKLFTSWLACEVMGEDARLHSEYSIEHGRLYFRPSGNPLLCEDSLIPMIEDCSERRIDEIVMDASFVQGGRYPETWNLGDVTESWGAPVSDVCFHENRVTASFSGSSPVPDKCVPAVPEGTFTFGKRGQKMKMRAGKIRLPEGFAGSVTYPILRPEAFLARWIGAKIANGPLRLVFKGGRLRGEPISVGEVTVADILVRMNKESSNVISELMLIHSAARSGKRPTTAAGTELLADRLMKSGISDTRLVDGSGLSRSNLTSPSSIIRLLEMCLKYSHLIASLPVGGRDGTLKDRNLDSRIVAKTGSLEGVQALSGFADGEPFSVMVNHFSSQDGAEEGIRSWIDSTVMSML